MNESEIRRYLCDMLEVSSSATDEEIKKAYAAEVKKWHPDRVQHNPELAAIANQKIKNINQAYECLTDSVQYDRYAAKLAQKQKDSATQSSSSRASANSTRFDSATDKTQASSATPPPVPNPSRADVVKIFVATGIFVLIVLAVVNITDSHREAPTNQGVTLSPEESPGSPITRTTYPSYQTPRPTLPADRSIGAPPGSN